jgi:hypothetical protein
MPVFDGRQRTDTGPARYSEGQFAYYNRSGRAEVGRIRELIERWVMSYPSGGRDEITARLRTDFEAFQSAFFELYIYHLLVALGNEVVLHPAVTGVSKRPDFLSTPHDGGLPTFVEAVVATDESHSQRIERRLQNRIQDDINSFQQTNFFLIVKRMIGRPENYPPRSTIHGFVASVLNGLDPDDVARRIESGERVSRTLLHRFSHGDFILKLYPWPKSLESRKTVDRNIGAGPIQVLRSTARVAIRAAIKAKARRYGELPHPYVVAVNCASQWGVDEDEVCEALLGQEQVMVPANTREFKLIYDGEGAFTHRSAPTNTRVSAVLAVHGLAPYSVPTARNRLYHHFAPRVPYSGSLDQLPSARVVANVIKNLPGNGPSTSELFGLPEGWPHVGSVDE